VEPPFIISSWHLTLEKEDNIWNSLYTGAYPLWYTAVALLTNVNSYWFHTSFQQAGQKQDRQNGNTAQCESQIKNSSIAWWKRMAKQLLTVENLGK
jgi:hypothetical protein